MIKKSEGIVLNYSKYKDTSIIVRILTNESSLQSFIVNNIRSPRSKKSIGYYQPLNIVEISYYQKPSQSLLRLNEIKLQQAQNSIQSKIKKTTLALFLSEILQKLFQHENQELGMVFIFLKDSIKALEILDKGVENFHLQFLLKLSNHIGFGIENTHQFFLKKDEDHNALLALLGEDYGIELNISGNRRMELLGSILQYYQNNISSFGTVKSLEVLHTIFHQ